MIRLTTPLNPLVTVCVACVFSTVATAADSYVAPNGNDAGPGTLTQPFGTLQAAVNQLQPGDTLWVRSGIYRETVKFPRSGTAEKPITVMPYRGEKVIVSGCEPVTGWTKGGDGVISRFETRVLNISRCAGVRRLGNGCTAYVGAWDRVGTGLSWEFSGSAGNYRLEAEAAAAGEAALGVACGSTKAAAKIAPTGGLEDYRVVALGVLTLGAAAEHKLELKS